MPSFNAIANNNESNSNMLESFHNYGITKCDKFIVENSPLKGNWNYHIRKHKDDIDDQVIEANIIQIYGQRNDTVKVDSSYIQTPKACYLHKRSTSSFAGSCASTIDLDYWYISKEMKDSDYTEYKNKGDVLLFAKEITVGNFKACVHEYYQSKAGKRDDE